MKTLFAILCVVMLTLAANVALDSFLHPEKVRIIPQEEMRGGECCQPMHEHSCGNSCMYQFDLRDKRRIIERLQHLMKNPEQDRGERFALEWVLQLRDTMEDTE